jgi:WD40 repeat protein
LLIENNHIVYSVAFSPDGKTLASGDGYGIIMLWDAITHQPIGQPIIGKGPSMWTAHVASFSPDGTTLAFCGDDGVVLWDLTARQPNGTLLTQDCEGVFFSPDSNTLVSYTDKTIILWDIEPQAWVNKSCHQTGRNFTRAEWENYGFTEPYRPTCPQWPIESEPTTTPTS